MRVCAASTQKYFNSEIKQVDLDFGMVPDDYYGRELRPTPISDMDPPAAAEVGAAAAEVLVSSLVPSAPNSSKKGVTAASATAAASKKASPASPAPAAPTLSPHPTSNAEVRWSLFKQHVFVLLDLFEATPFSAAEWTQVCH